MTTLSKANTTAQWYEDDYPGADMPRLDKFVIHTTETKGWPGYGGGASAPNATYHPGLRSIRQHFSNLTSARALKDPSGTTVRENRDNVFQLEVVCFSDYSAAKKADGLWVGDLSDDHMSDIAGIIRELGKHGLKARSTVTWKEGQKTYVSGVRLSGPSYDAYSGVLGHMHVSGNSHWDPGGFRWSKLAAALGGSPGEEDDEMLTPFLSKYGSSQYRLIIPGAAPIPITESWFNKMSAGASGLPVNTLSNAAIEGLAYYLPALHPAVHRGGELISWLQELADSKTLGLANQAKLDVILDALGKVQGIDPDALAEKVAEKVKTIEVDDVVAEIGERLTPTE